MDIETFERGYTEDYFENKYQVAMRTKKLLEILERYAHEHVLEIGCGTTFLAAKVSDFESWTIVEPSPMFIKKTKDVVGSRINVIQGYFEDSVERLLNLKYDMVIASAVFHLVEKQGRFIEKLLEVANANTVVHIDVPNANSFHRLWACAMGMIADKYDMSLRNPALNQYRVYDMDSLVEELKKGAKRAGRHLEILNSGGYFIKPFTHKQMESCINHGIIDEKMLYGLYSLAEYIPEISSEIYVDFRVV